MKEDFTEPLIKGEKDKIEKKLSKKYKEDNNDDNDEEDNEFSNLISKKVKINKEIINKNHIITKIYFFFFLQVSITYIFIYYSFKNQIFQKLIKQNTQLFILSIAITGIIFFSSYKWKEVLTTMPFNYFFFLVFTLGISFLICKITILFSFPTITVLWILLLIMILSLSAYAYNSTKDIKITEAIIFVTFILISFGIIIKFVAKIPIMDIILMLFCLISLAIYLIYDVKKLIEEKKIGQKDSILVNLLLYTDIFRIFVKLINFLVKELGKVLNNEDKSKLNELKEVNEDIEKGFKELKNILEKDDDGDDDEDDKKGKGKDKDDKGKKNDKKKDDKKKDDKKKDDKKKDNKKKDDKKKDDKKKDDKKKNDKDKKEKKDDKKNKDKKDKKKDDKKDKKDDKGKKGKKKKTQKDDDEDDDEDEENNFFGDPEDIGKKVGEFFSDILSK